jgi:hypothetical protein
MSNNPGPVFQLVTNYEFIDHGLQHPDFFQGCGVALTKYDECFTGIGNTPAEAANEALDLATHDYRWNDTVLSDAEFEATDDFSYDHETIPDDSEAMYHVSIRIKTVA